jgi:hypothetical protein
VDIAPGRLIQINVLPRGGWRFVHAGYRHARSFGSHEIAMTTSVQPRLSHCGIYVNDVGTQVDFYTRVLGLIVSDRGVSPRIGNEFAF